MISYDFYEHHEADVETSRVGNKENKEKPEDGELKGDTYNMENRFNYDWMSSHFIPKTSSFFQIKIVMQWNLLQPAGCWTFLFQIQIVIHVSI